MIRIAICDDNRNDAQDTKSLLMSFMEENVAAAFQVKVFSSAAQLLASMSSEPPYHLYLLDILMPDRNGIDLGREIHILILLHWLFIFPPRRTLPWMPFMSSPSSIS